MQEHRTLQQMVKARLVMTCYGAADLGFLNPILVCNYRQSCSIEASAESASDSLRKG